MERNTKQRKAIRTVLDEADRPLTPHEVLVAAQQLVPSLGIATVYRTLNGLERDGLAASVEIPGDPTRYELAGKRHHHFFRCRRCSRVYEIQGCLGTGEELVPQGFRLEGHELLLFGICDDCAALESA